MSMDGSVGVGFGFAGGGVNGGVTVTGAESLAVTFNHDQFVVGGTTVRFRQKDGVSIANSLTVEGARIDDELQFSRGAISFKR